MIDSWEESTHLLEDDCDCHASLTHEEIEASGEPTRPLEFPTPVVYEGELTELTASDHRTGAEYFLKNVLRRNGDTSVAYLMKKKLAKSSYGSVRLGVVLRRVSKHEEEKNGKPFQPKWQSTGEFVAIKCSSWAKIQSLRGRHLVDPIKEISVLQLIGKGSSEHHVMGCIEVLQDMEYLYTIMPYCAGGELYGKLDISGLRLYPDEDEARQYFRQLLKSLVFMQRKGICHRNICLENLLLDDDDKLVLIDSGLALRVPYGDPCNIDGVTDVSEGSTRRLMRPQGQCGKLMYLAPEILEQKAFDGHATDLWSAGIILFIMLVGVAPFGLAQCSDKRFEKVTQGGLKSFLQSLDVSLSCEAVDLLQNMFWQNPRERLTLAEVMGHPWVLGQRLPVESTQSIVDITRTMNCVLKTTFDGKAADEASEGGTVDDASEGSMVDSEKRGPTPVSPPRKHRRKLSSGARDLMGKFKYMMQKKRATGTQVCV